MGYGRGGESLQLESMACAYADIASPLRCIPELRSLPATSEEAYKQLTKLLGTRSPAHSLRHSVAIAWLFGSFEAFEAACGKTPAPALSPSAANRPSSARQTMRSHIIEALQADAASVTALAARLGVDVTTVMAVAARVCPERLSGRRPKVLSPTRRIELVDALRRGDDKLVAAQQAVVSLSTVTRVLRTEPGLQEQWHFARSTAARASARQTWQRVIGQNPLLGVKALRLLEPATYAWLYRNDRAWLEARKPTDPEKRPLVPRVRWDTRDRELADCVEQMALELASTRGAGPVALWEIYQRLPDLKAKLGKLDRLPLTVRALRRVVTRSHY